MEERSEFSEYLLENGQCCICDDPLSDSEHLNLIQLDKVATWKYPVWGNILSEDKEINHAIAVVCDYCISPEGQIIGEIKFAIEVDMAEDKTQTIYYHDVRKLQSGSPTFSEDVKMSLEADAMRDEILNAVYGVTPKDEVKLAVRGIETAKEINEKMLRQSHYYIMLVSQGYIRGLKNSEDPQHQDFMNQLSITREEGKPAIIIQDIQVTDEEIAYLKEIMKGIEIVGWIIDDMKKMSEETTEKVRKILKSLEIHIPANCKDNCPIVDNCPMDYNIPRCSWKLHFQETGVWGKKNV